MRVLRAARPGWSLIELVVVMFGLSIVMGLLGTMIWAAMRIEHASVDAFTRVQQQIELADRFRADVAQGSESPVAPGDFEASPVCMLLRAPDDGLVIYQWADGRLVRRVLGETGEESQDLPVGGDDLRVSFGRRGRLWTMELQGPHRAPLVIAAALGRDRP